MKEGKVLNSFGRGGGSDLDTIKVIGMGRGNGYNTPNKKQKNDNGKFVSIIEYFDMPLEKLVRVSCKFQFENSQTQF